MQNANSCYGTTGHADRVLPSLWSPTAPTVMPSKGDDKGELSISQRLFGREVRLINCDGPCVSEDALERAFAGCAG